MISCTEICILASSICLVILIKLLNCNPQPILNVYQRPNGFYWLKVAFMYTILATRKFIFKIKCKLIKNFIKYEDLDKVQKFSHHPQAIDAVYFNGANKNGDFFVIATARRKNRLVDGFFYLLIKESGLGLLESPKLPATSLYQNEDLEEYSAEGFKIFCIVPMKKWRIIYQGKMKRHENRDEVVDVNIDAIWSSDLPYFNFDTDMDPLCMAKSMAYEKFSREYFDNLKKSHQTHYEQHGDINGTAIINEKSYKISVNALRDHSFGEHREWRMFHRYGLHFVSAANGDRFNVGMICMPISFSRLTIGYVYCAADKKIYPVDYCDLQLYQHGENAEPPRDYAFSFRAGGKMYTMQVNVVHSPHFYISKDWEAKIFEGLCDFEVNGIKAWGAAEWQYRNIKGKKVADFVEIKN